MKAQRTQLRDSRKEEYEQARTACGRSAARSTCGLAQRIRRQVGQAIAELNRIGPATGGRRGCPAATIRTGYGLDRELSDLAKP